MKPEQILKLADKFEKEVEEIEAAPPTLRSVTELPPASPDITAAEKLRRLLRNKGILSEKLKINDPKGRSFNSVSFSLLGNGSLGQFMEAKKILQVVLGTPTQYTDVFEWHLSHIRVTLLHSRSTPINWIMVDDLPAVLKKNRASRKKQEITPFPPSVDAQDLILAGE